MSKLFIAGVIWNIRTSYASSCSELDRLLDLGAGSYAENEYCHALFWEHERGRGPVCTNSIVSPIACPGGLPVQVSEAEGILRSRRSSETQTTIQPVAIVEPAGSTSQVANIPKDEELKVRGNALGSVGASATLLPRLAGIPISARSVNPKDCVMVTPRREARMSETQTTTQFAPSVEVVESTLPIETIPKDNQSRGSVSTFLPRLAGIPISSGWLKPDGPVELEPMITARRDVIDILVLGDVGEFVPDLEDTVLVAQAKMSSFVDSAVLLGDNFFSTGIPNDVNDIQFKDVFVKRITAHFPKTTFHALLGNNDWDGNVDAQLEYTSINPQWQMPYYYYRRRYVSSDGSVNACIWFLDTTNFRTPQIVWLRSSLSDPSCMWKIVAGHHPIYDHGTYMDNKLLERSLRPLLDESGVHMYIAGHDHTSMVLYRPEISPVRFLINGRASAGHVIERMPRIVDGKVVAEFSKLDPPHFDNPIEHAFVQITFTASHLTYTFHSADRGPEEPPLYIGTIEI
jgi:tartrate-resistant acid phosphatase type 5